MDHVCQLNVCMNKLEPAGSCQKHLNTVAVMFPIVSYLNARLLEMEMSTCRSKEIIITIIIII